MVGRRGRTGGRMGGREEGREGRRVLGTPVVVSIHSAMTCWREGLRAVGR